MHVKFVKSLPAKSPNYVSGSTLAFSCGAIQIFRYVVGNTDPKKAQRGSVRYVFGDKTRSIMYNAVHASDGLESFIREIEIHFSRDELGVEFWTRLDAYKQWLEHFRDRS